MQDTLQILIIDDETQLRQMISRLLRSEGYEVIQAADAKSGLKQLEKNGFPLVLCDVRLPDANGVELVRTIKQVQPLSEVILLTAYGNIPDGVQAIKNGAFDYLVKGDDNNRIIPMVSKAMDKALLQWKMKKKTQLSGGYTFSDLIGSSPAILAAAVLAKKVAPSNTTVLLTGETGTGKEIFAAAIHNASPRKEYPFVAINCSAFSREILESELFGHKAGAFTGAIKDTKGIFEEADNGTVFLDEIGEMPLDLQAKLLRVLETGEFMKVGDSKNMKVNIRIIAATNRDLQKEITAGHFREDLFYRISVFQIILPPLRERVGDIEAISHYFLKYFAARTNKKISGISKDCLEALKLHDWKGNIRELKNVIERSVILADYNELDVGNLPAEFQKTSISSSKEKQLSAFNLVSVEKNHIEKVMNYTNGNKTETARLLNIALTTLYRKLDEYGIK